MSTLQKSSLGFHDKISESCLNKRRIYNVLGSLSNCNYLQACVSLYFWCLSMVTWFVNGDLRQDHVQCLMSSVSLSISFMTRIIWKSESSRTQRQSLQKSIENNKTFRMFKETVTRPSESFKGQHIKPSETSWEQQSNFQKAQGISSETLWKLWGTRNKKQTTTPKTQHYRKLKRTAIKPSESLKEQQ